MVYDINNFVKTPNPGDRVIFIYDPNNVVTMTFDPYSSTFFHKSKFVYVLSDGKMDINNVLEFGTSQISSDAVTKLNDIKKQFIDGLSKECGLDPTYFTSAQTEVRYVNIIGDTMSGDLSITPLSFVGGDLYERNTNVDSNGKIIIGNQFRIHKENVHSSIFVDSFLKTDSFSCIWFYSVKDGINLRSGQISAVWEEVGNYIAFSHTTTNSIGTTDNIDFEVNMDQGNSYVRLFATITSGDWNIRMLRLFI